ncbi:hypothetical protein NX862_12885 [Rhodobacter sp. KR11]|jgi:hypothetical protein|uniref:hypothetical protein n=1 Tax=Rhodobacter sp. KR11 TaxID=2974588 RepID=UPI002222A271|nr:hypothetical protein [Rhodobacter sp. KR11]MCW1919651.1 hypothetical protein [Rhodobacter sp. KR11]
MTGELPQYYFRIRDNGAVVFRVESEQRQRRLELVEIALVNIKNGNIKPHGETELTEGDRAEIAAWLASRRALQAERDIDDILRTVDHLNMTAQWVQTRATDEEVDRVLDPLLMAMHDLRSVLIRRRADKLDQRAPRS